MEHVKLTSFSKIRLDLAAQVRLMALHPINCVKSVHLVLGLPSVNHFINSKWALYGSACQEVSRTFH